jgi:DNA-binding transcriptional MerR regulator
VQLILLAPSEFRGTATRYQRRALLRLFGILRLKSEARISLAEIKRQLHVFSEKQLEAWLLARPLPPTAATALGLATPSTDAKRVATSVPADAADSRLGGHASLAPATSTWQRVSLLPGLELMISADASPAVRRAAHSICAEYVASGNS